MNKENKEQPENLKKQESSEDNFDVQEAQRRERKLKENPIDEQGGNEDETFDEAPEVKRKKTSRAEVGVAPAETSETVEKVISINRITKVTKGGKKLSFSALVVVGDMRGNVGYSLSKAAEVSIAIRKALATAKKNMVKIPMKGTTIPHEIIGRCSGSRVLLKPASDGTGVIASGPVRAVCDGAGIHNILTKCHRSNNPINVVKATLDGLTRLKMVEPVKE